MSHTEPATNPAFSAEERAAFGREDRHATAAVFIITVSVFLVGLVLYSIVYFACVE